MITVTFKFEDRYGPMYSFTCDMPCVPRVDEKVWIDSLFGSVTNVEWQPSDTETIATVWVRTE